MSAELQTQRLCYRRDGSAGGSAHRGSARAQTRAVAGGGDAARLEWLIEQAITNDCRGIISFGMAGGLGADLTAGTCLIGREVIVHGSARYPADETWTARLQGSARRKPSSVGIAGVDWPLVATAQKQALFAATGAAAADMESHVVARIAASSTNLPFAVLRVVADPAGARPASGGARGHASRMGRTDAIGGRSFILRKNPGQFPQLVRVAADALPRLCSATPLPPAFWDPGLGLLDLR